MHCGNLKRGSFTVEMACLMPLYLFVILGLIYLCFFIHNRAWLTAAAHEAALKGCVEGTETAADTKARELVNRGLFGAENLQMQADGKGERIIVQFDSDTVFGYGGLTWHLQVKAKEKRTRPVPFIWRLKGVEGLGE